MEYSLTNQTRVIIGRLLDSAAFVLLLVLALTLAFEHTRPWVTVGPIVLTNVESAVLLTIIFWLLARMFGGRSIMLPRQIWLPGLVWLAGLTLSTLLAPSFHDQAFLFMGRVLAGVIIALITFNVVTTRERRLAIIVAMVSGAILVAVLGLAEGFGVEPLVAWLDGFKVSPTRVGDVLRVSSTLSYATITAMVLEMILPLLLVLFLLARRSAVRVLLAAGVVLILATHVLTLSRAGVISLLAALTLMAFVGWRRRRPALIAAAASTAFLLLVLVALVLVGKPTTRLRLTTETEQAWYQVRYDVKETVSAAPGQQVLVPVIVTNTGERSWLPDGEFFFSLSYHLHDDEGQTVTYDGLRSPLPGIVAPGESASIEGLIRAPEEPGRYTVEWDMVQESVTWFSWKDAPTFTTDLLVKAGQPTHGAEIAVSPSPTDVRVTNPTPGRLELWRAALQMAVDRPILGVGPDNFRWQYGAYAGLEEWDTGIHANNLYLEWLAGTGIVGLLAFLWFSWRLARLALAHQSDQAGETTWLLTLGLVAGLLTWYVHGVFDFFYEFTPTYVAFWLLVGLLASMPLSLRGAYANRF